MNLSDRNLAVCAEPFGDIDHRRRYIQMERSFEPSVWNPLRQRFKVIDRFDGLDLDYGGDFPPPVLRHQNDVGVHRGHAGADRAVLLRAGIDPDIEATAKLGL